MPLESSIGDKTQKGGEEEGAVEKEKEGWRRERKKERGKREKGGVEYPADLTGYLWVSKAAKKLWQNGVRHTLGTSNGDIILWL